MHYATSGGIVEKCVFVVDDETAKKEVVKINLFAVNKMYFVYVQSCEKESVPLLHF